jgi:hypothetical protein
MAIAIQFSKLALIWAALWVKLPLKQTQKYFRSSPEWRNSML